MFQLLHYFLKTFGSLLFLNQSLLVHDLCLEKILSLMFLLQFALEQMYVLKEMKVSVADNIIAAPSRAIIVVVFFRLSILLI